MSEIIDNASTLNDPTLSPTTQQQPGPASTTTTTSTSTGHIADHTAFINYLKQFIPAILDANSTSTIEFEKCLNEKSSTECIKKFLGDPQVRTLIIQRFYTKGKLHLLINPSF